MQLAARLSSWDKLPAEMKYAVADHLNTHEIHKFSRLSRETYALSIPSLYKVSLFFFDSYFSDLTWIAL